MKFLFTLSVGVVIGWASTLCDMEGQLALEQHQIRVDNHLHYQAAAAKVEDNKPAASFLFSWP